jgi:hypothetical protein
VPLLTTAAAALAAANGIGDWAQSDLQVRSLQEFHAGVWVSKDSASDTYLKSNPVELR